MQPWRPANPVRSSIGPSDSPDAATRTLPPQVRHPRYRAWSMGSSRASTLSPSPPRPQTHAWTRVFSLERTGLIAPPSSPSTLSAPIIPVGWLLPRPKQLVLLTETS